ncbi:MAG: hypothetical protein LBE75_01600 [Burkholderiales bacterium]|jgi:hypothetical protein|nr:hypothetical protein [Burkholderiales bacterium]
MIEQLEVATPLLAKTLGQGLEAAVLIAYSEWEKMLNEHVSIEEEATVDDRGDNCATYELLPIQKFEEGGYSTIEVRVAANDGYHQLTAYYYPKSTGIDVAT